MGNKVFSKWITVRQGKCYIIVLAQYEFLNIIKAGNEKEIKRQKAKEKNIIGYLLIRSSSTPFYKYKRIKLFRST